MHAQKLNKDVENNSSDHENLGIQIHVFTSGVSYTELSTQFYPRVIVRRRKLGYGQKDGHSSPLRP